MPAPVAVYVFEICDVVAVIVVYDGVPLPFTNAYATIPLLESGSVAFPVIVILLPAHVVALADKLSIVGAVVSIYTFILDC